MIKADTNNIILKKIPNINYCFWFKTDKMKALINFGNKNNSILLDFVLKLSLKVY